MVASADTSEPRFLLADDFQAAKDLDGFLVVNPFGTDPAMPEA
jgi:hypothetical protein